jgi:hypothetical protein
MDLIRAMVRKTSPILNFVTLPASGGQEQAARGAIGA